MEQRFVRGDWLRAARQRISVLGRFKLLWAFIIIMGFIIVVMIRGVMGRLEKTFGGDTPRYRVIKRIMAFLGW